MSLQVYPVIGENKYKKEVFDLPSVGNSIRGREFSKKLVVRKS